MEIPRAGRGGHHGADGDLRPNLRSEGRIWGGCLICGSENRRWGVNRSSGSKTEAGRDSERRRQAGSSIFRLRRSTVGDILRYTRPEDRTPLHLRRTLLPSSKDPPSSKNLPPTFEEPPSSKNPPIFEESLLHYLRSSEPKPPHLRSSEPKNEETPSSIFDLWPCKSNSPLLLRSSTPKNTQKIGRKRGVYDFFEDEGSFENRIIRSSGS